MILGLCIKFEQGLLVAVGGRFDPRRRSSAGHVAGDRSHKEEAESMFAKMLGVAVLVIAALVALSIAGFILSIIWKVGMIVLVIAVGYFGWKLLKD